jgi:hypothetical protein
MKTMLYKASASIVSALQMLSVKRIFAAVLVSFLVLTTAVDLAQADDTLGERMRDRIEQADRNSDRPKTTGELMDEAHSDMPLGERLQRIGKESGEAFKQFGQEYSVGAQESVRNVQDKAADAGEDVVNRVR